MPKSALVTRVGVAIAQVGTWSTMTTEWVCTAEQLADAVAAQHDPAFRTPVVKLGHLDPRFTDGELLGDGEPAVGRLVNLRTTVDGLTLLADWVGVPAWLDEIVASAYPSRSIEAELDVTTSDGTHYEMVVTGLALLGVTMPAIQSLGDLAALYETTTEVGDWVAARSVAASALPDEGGAMPEGTLPRRPSQVVASASIDELCRAFEEWAGDSPDIGFDVWVRDIYTDHLVASAWVGDDPRYYSVPWTEANGVFTFGAVTQVKPSYEPVAVAGAGERAPIARVRLRADAPLPVQFARGRDRVTPVSAAHPEEPRVPIPAAVADLLGIPADADDDTARAAVEALKAAAVPTATTTPPEKDDDADDGDDADDAPAEPADVRELVNAAVAAALKPVLASLTTTSQELSAIKAERVAATRSSIVGDAVNAGKIRPTDRATFEAQYDAAPDVVTAILAAIAPGTAVPVSALGHAGDSGPTSEDQALYEALFGKASV